MIQHERRDVQESVPGPKCLASTLCQLTVIHIPTWRLDRERGFRVDDANNVCLLLYVSKTSKA